jgi:predicted Zn-dependent protease
MKTQRLGFGLSKRRALSKLFALLTLGVVAACVTSPLGRQQLKIMPDSQMDAMGVQAFQQMKSSQPIERDSALNAYVRCVAEPIAAVSGSELTPKQWEVVVFKDQTANAFALPGGKIGVHTGLLRVAKTDGELAAVLGHEVGHVLAGHGNERVSESLVVNLGLAGTAAILSGGQKKKDDRFGLLMAALGVGAQFGILLPHSRDQESEADIIGLKLMAKAGFDPHESVALWKNMIADSGGRAPPEFLSTHPASENRIENLEAKIPKVMPDFERLKASGAIPHCQRPRG